MIWKYEILQSCLFKTAWKVWVSENLSLSQTSTDAIVEMLWNQIALPQDEITCCIIIEEFLLLIEERSCNKVHKKCYTSIIIRIQNISGHNLHLVCSIFFPLSLQPDKRYELYHPPWCSFWCILFSVVKWQNAAEEVDFINLKHFFNNLLDRECVPRSLVILENWLKGFLWDGCPSELFLFIIILYFLSMYCNFWCIIFKILEMLFCIYFWILTSECFSKILHLLK